MWFTGPWCQSASNGQQTVVLFSRAKPIQAELIFKRKRRSSWMIRFINYYTVSTFAQSKLSNPNSPRYEAVDKHARPDRALPAAQTMAEVMERRASPPRLAQPDDQWNYRVSYDLSGAIAEAVTLEE